jgi:hypothetical protein
LDCNFKAFSGKRTILSRDNLGIELRNFVFKFDFPGTSSAEAFFEVLDFLFKFNDLIFFFVEEICEVEVSCSSFIVLS